jgi:hypothetical protein
MSAPAKEPKRPEMRNILRRRKVVVSQKFCSFLVLSDTFENATEVRIDDFSGGPIGKDKTGKAK